jgi:hypothetical protein
VVSVAGKGSLSAGHMLMIKQLTAAAAMMLIEE